jgi:hypothetical protein
VKVLPGHGWITEKSPALLASEVMCRRGMSLELVRCGFERSEAMLMTILVLLLILWLLGVVTSYTLGGFIHLLLIVAIAVILIRIIQGRRPV